jgi:hypothetical protein
VQRPDQDARCGSEAGGADERDERDGGDGPGGVESAGHSTSVIGLCRRNEWPDGHHAQESSHERPVTLLTFAQ